MVGCPPIGFPVFVSNPFTENDALFRLLISGISRTIISSACIGQKRTGRHPMPLRKYHIRFRIHLPGDEYPKRITPVFTLTANTFSGIMNRFTAAGILKGESVLVILRGGIAIRQLRTGDFFTGIKASQRIISLAQLKTVRGFSARQPSSILLYHILFG